MEKLAAVLFFSTLVGNTLEDDIAASRAEVFSSEGSSVTLSCNYSVKADNLQWYQQDPGSAPQFLLLITDTKEPSVVRATPPHPRLIAELNDKRNRVHLQISSAAVTDSAVYYRDGNNNPKFILSCSQFGTVNTEKKYEERFSSKVNATSNSVPLKIQKLQLLMLRRRADICCLFDLNNSKDMSLYLFILFSHFIALGSMNSIKSERSEERVEEGRNINLTCKYEGAINNIQWYRQYQRSRPEFLLYITEGGFIHQTDSEFSADINKEDKRVDLNIISAAVTDSAVYYCAL
ncbi:uncharacterized protein LOC115572828, partial [Sparus aurata]|uniref:uncharacterized protein LOC115572828 n=1 Tax=Sparus aurata TaxID=8175 RepID=UPI0011C19949